MTYKEISQKIFSDAGTHVDGTVFDEAYIAKCANALDANASDNEVKKLTELLELCKECHRLQIIINTERHRKIRRKSTKK